MALNCRVGDLAFVTRDAPFEESAGLIVEVLESRGYYGTDFAGHFHPELAGTARWWVRSNRPVRCVSGVVSSEFICGDIFLRPIRDPGDDAVDEILQRVGAPAESYSLWSC